MLRSYGQNQLTAATQSAAVFEARDIPILSSTDRIQRALLSWVDLCGLSGHYNAGADALEKLRELGLLDPFTYVLEVDSPEIRTSTVIWAGVDVAFTAGGNLEEALVSCINDGRFTDLIVREYLDALRYRRASARRFAHREGNKVDSMDQLIFPLKDTEKSEFILVIGESVSGRTLYAPSAEQTVTQETAQ
jgi:hypothetical protein